MDQEREGVPRNFAPKKRSWERDRSTSEGQSDPKRTHYAAGEDGAIRELKDASGRKYRHGRTVRFVAKRLNDVVNRERSGARMLSEHASEAIREFRSVVHDA
jgi:hypothetical protein